MTLVYTLILYVGSNIALALVSDSAMLLIFRALQAAGSSSTIALGSGVIADISPPSERGGYLGWFSGGILSPRQVQHRLLTPNASATAQSSSWASDWWPPCWFCGLAIYLLVFDRILGLVCGRSPSHSSGDAASDRGQWRATAAKLEASSTLVVVPTTSRQDQLS